MTMCEARRSGGRLTHPNPNHNPNHNPNPNPNQVQLGDQGVTELAAALDTGALPRLTFLDTSRATCSPTLA